MYIVIQNLDYGEYIIEDFNTIKEVRKWIKYEIDNCYANIKDFEVIRGRYLEITKEFLK